MRNNVPERIILCLDCYTDLRSLNAESERHRFKTFIQSFLTVKSHINVKHEFFICTLENEPSLYFASNKGTNKWEIAINSVSLGDNSQLFTAKASILSTRSLDWLHATIRHLPMEFTLNSNGCNLTGLLNLAECLMEYSDSNHLEPTSVVRCILIYRRKECEPEVDRDKLRRLVSSGSFFFDVIQMCDPPDVLQPTFWAWRTFNHLYEECLSFASQLPNSGNYCLLSTLDQLGQKLGRLLAHPFQRIPCASEVCALEQSKSPSPTRKHLYQNLAWKTTL